GGAAQVAGHVPADPDLHGRGRLQAVMGVKAGHLVQPAERDVGPLRQGAELIRRQVTAALLDFMKCLDNHGRSRRSTGPVPAFWHPSPGEGGVVILERPGWHVKESLSWVSNPRNAASDTIYPFAQMCQLSFLKFSF